VHDGRNLRRSKSGRDRNNCKSAPGPDTQRTGKTWPMQRRYGRIGRRNLDERAAFRDIDRTCVPGTVWGTAASGTCKSRSAPCLTWKRPSLTQQPPRRQHAQRPSVSPLPSPSRREKSRQAHNSAIYARILAAIDKYFPNLCEAYRFRLHLGSHARISEGDVEKLNA
jgi:hypothetical protein